MLCIERASAARARASALRSQPVSAAGRLQLGAGLRQVRRQRNAVYLARGERGVEFVHVLARPHCQQVAFALRIGVHSWCISAAGSDSAGVAGGST